MQDAQLVAKHVPLQKYVDASHLEQLYPEHSKQPGRVVQSLHLSSVIS